MLASISKIEFIKNCIETCNECNFRLCDCAFCNFFIFEHPVEFIVEFFDFSIFENNFPDLHLCEFRKQFL